MTLEQYDYVNSIFRMRFPEFYLLNETDKGLKDSKIRSIIESVCKAELSKFSKDDYGDVKVENEIFKALDNRLDTLFSKNLRDSIKEKFTYIYSDKFVSKYVGLCSYDLIRYMAGQILMIFRDKDVVSCDDKIVFHYDELYTRLTNIIKKKVEKLIVEDIDTIYLDKDYEYMVDNIVRDVMLNFDNKYFGILEKREFNKEILSVMWKNIHKPKLKKEISSEQFAHDYIFERVSAEFSSILDLNECRKCSDFVYKKLIVSEGCDLLDIAGKIYDSRITNLSNFWLNSCRVKNTSVEEEYKPKTKKSPKTVITLLLVGALVVGGASVAVYNDNRDKKIESAAVHIMLEDGFYQGDKATMAYDYTYNAKKVLAAYNKRVDLLPNERCDYIAFSEAYLQLDTSIGTKLVIMDKLLSDLTYQTSTGKSNNKLYYGIVKNRCYLELIYDSLRYMGYEEIDQNQYDLLLNKYKEIRKEFPNERDPISKMSPFERSLIEKIESEYVKLSKEKLYYIASLPIYGDVASKNEVRSGRL